MTAKGILETGVMRTAGDRVLNQLVDLRSIDISTAGDTAAAAKSFFERIKNPYCFRVGEIIVHVEFGGPSSEPLQTHIQNILFRASNL